MEKLIERHPHSLRKLLGLADAFIVLSRDYRQALERWGIQRPVFLETTIVPDDWTKNVDLEKKLQALQQKSKWTILFLAEIIGDKGVYLAIDAIRILRGKFSNVELIIAGDGIDLACAQAYVRRTMVGGVIFTGYVSGLAKRKVLEESDIFCLPTLLSEGLPVAVVEAMCFGLPIVTRAVGGLKDLFEETNCGYITKSKDGAVIAELLAQLIGDRKQYARIARNNYLYSRNHFLASTAAQRLRCIYDTVYSSTFR
jgi:glycosyltransferase involved in cell wall biosynthesis